jgi:hypothetical protein
LALIEVKLVELSIAPWAKTTGRLALHCLALNTYNRNQSKTTTLFRGIQQSQATTHVEMYPAFKTLISQGNSSRSAL